MPGRIHLLLAVALALLPGCDEIRDQRKQAFLSKLAGLEAYSGVFRERFDAGTGAPVETRTHVVFRRPFSFDSEVLAAPAPFAGTRTTYDGRDLSVYYPRAGFGFELRGFQPATPAVEQRRLGVLYDRMLADYRWNSVANDEVAGRPAVGFEYEPRKPGPLRPAEARWFFEEFSFPLRRELRRGERVLYRSEFERIEFNPAPARERFRRPLPAGAGLVWDFQAARYDLARLRAEANFTPRLPPALEAYRLRAGASAPGLIPAFALWFEQDPFFVVCMLYRDYGIAPVPLERGIRLEQDGRVFYLAFAGVYPVVQYRHRGVIYHLVGSLPYTDLLDMATSAP